MGVPLLLDLENDMSTFASHLWNSGFRPGTERAIRVPPISAFSTASIGSYHHAWSVCHCPLMTRSRRTHEMLDKTRISRYLILIIGYSYIMTSTPGKRMSDRRNFRFVLIFSPLMMTAGIVNRIRSQTNERLELTEYTRPHWRHVKPLDSACHAYGHSPVTGVQWKMIRKICGRYAAERNPAATRMMLISLRLLTPTIRL